MHYNSTANAFCSIVSARDSGILRIRHSRLILTLLGLTMVSACGTAPGDSPPPNATASVSSAPATPTGIASIAIKGFAYAPQTLTVPVGTTVNWKNLDDEPHTVRGADEQIRSNALDQNETYSVKFDKPGTYKYGCSIHPKMSGTIVVK